MNPPTPQQPPQTPNIQGYIQAAQAQGISSDEIYGHLKSLGYVDSQGNISTSKQAPAPAPSNVGTDVTNYADDVGTGLENTFNQGAKNVMSDVENIPKNTGNVASDQNTVVGKAGDVAADVAATATGAGHVAGDIAGTAGGILGAVISPLLPASVKNSIGDATKYVSDKVNAIPGMTPEIAKSLGDLFNTGSLLGGSEAEPGVKAGVSAAAGAGSDALQSVADTAVSAKNAVTDAAGTVGSKLSDAATSITPNMQTLIDRVKNTPEEASTIANQIKGYFKTAESAKGVTGAPTPLDTAGAQFKPAMDALKTKMGATGEAMKAALAPVADAKATGVSDVLSNLKDMTSERVGAQYAPMEEGSADTLKGMTFPQRVQHLNDIIDGTKPDPFGGDGVFHSAPGREMTVSSAPDIKKLANLHETLSNLGDNPTVQQLHDTVQRLQSDLYKSSKIGAEPIDSNVKGIMKQTVGMLNEKAKTTAMEAEKAKGLTPGAYADAKSQYGELADLQNNMSRRLGTGYKNASSLVKKVFSPQNNGLNPLIKNLETHSGVPILDHATMADFAMRAVKDPRITSLLEKGASGAKDAQSFIDALKNIDITKPASWVGPITQQVTSRLSDPLGSTLRKLGSK